ncbi:hypothetical protein SteCoe_20199 [Stentor coeruleus]|uniref:Uncharacterized protein n=1 Tax=Stentor coeruleus TaxID=5963 RepID=A0A1R2BSP2_9CILI|nr:hypothetical protein SteCoe_20199 [Stentor coeruleus]
MINLSNRNLSKYEVPRNIRELDISYNQLQGLSYIPETLEKLDISHNKIAMIDVLSAKNALLAINLSYNRLIAIEGIICFTKLQILDLSYNFLSADQFKYLQALPCLKSLNVSHNHLSSDNTLACLNTIQTLTELNMSFNDFTKISMKNLMGSLKKLIIDNNKITSLSLNKFPSLEYISCVENNLTEFFGLTSLQYLTQLYADGNDLTELPSLAKLRVLSIAHNRLSSLANYPSLEIINASYNNISSIQKVAIGIQEIIIAHNMLMMLPFGMKRLEILDVSHNNIQKLDFLIGCESLKVLSAGFNYLENPEEILTKVSRCPLEELDMGLALEENVYFMYLNALPSLQKLNLCNVTGEDRRRAGVCKEISMEITADFNKLQSSENKIGQNKEQERSLCLEIPEQSTLSKLSPNFSLAEEPAKRPYLKNITTSADSSVELTLINPYISKIQNKLPTESPRNPCLTPSKTESFSILPSTITDYIKKSESPLQQSPEIPPNPHFPDKINDFYKSFMTQMQQSLSKKFSELAKIPPSPRHQCKHNYKHHKDQKSKTLTIDVNTPISKTINDKVFKPSNIKCSTPLSSQGSRCTRIEREFSASPACESELYSVASKYAGTPSSFSIKNLKDSIIKYAIIPPRPILKCEYNSALVTNLNTRSQEYQCLVSYFAYCTLKVSQIRKTFTFGLMKGKVFKDLVYYYAETHELSDIIYCSEGFGNKNVTLYKRPAHRCAVVLVCLTNISELKETYKDTYQVGHIKAVIPAYLVSYSNFE